MIFSTNFNIWDYRKISHNLIPVINRYGRVPLTTPIRVVYLEIPFAIITLFLHDFSFEAIVLYAGNEGIVHIYTPPIDLAPYPCDLPFLDVRFALPCALLSILWTHHNITTIVPIAKKIHPMYSVYSMVMLMQTPQHCKITYC